MRQKNDRWQRVDRCSECALSGEERKGRNEGRSNSHWGKKLARKRARNKSVAPHENQSPHAKELQRARGQARERERERERGSNRRSRWLQHAHTAPESSASRRSHVHRLHRTWTPRRTYHAYPSLTVRTDDPYGSRTPRRRSNKCPRAFQQLPGATTGERERQRPRPRQRQREKS